MTGAFVSRVAVVGVFSVNMLCPQQVTADDVSPKIVERKVNEIEVLDGKLDVINKREFFPANSGPVVKVFSSEVVGMIFLKRVKVGDVIQVGSRVVVVGGVYANEYKDEIKVKNSVLARAGDVMCYIIGVGDDPAVIKESIPGTYLVAKKCKPLVCDHR